MKVKLISHSLSAPEAMYFYFMGQNGECFFKIYEYSNDSTFCVFSELSVSNKFRKKGIGDFALSFAVDLANSMNCDFIYLWVDKDSWMFDWYKRRGFVEIEEFKDIPNNVWMRKHLK